MLACSAAWAGSLPRCLKPEAVWDLRGLSDPQIDPSGRTIAYVEDWTDILDDSSYSNIYLIAPDGSHRRVLNSGKFREASPRWSPDGKRLAYLSSRRGKTQLHVRDMSSGADAVITDGAEAPSLPAWSPDGKWIAFLRFHPGAPGWNPELPAKPEGAKWAPQALALTNLRYTFDGAGVLRPGTNRIFAIPAGGGEERQITPEGYFHTSYLFEPELAWSADSHSILSPAVRSKEGWDNYTGGEIFRFPLDGQAPAALTRFSGYKTAVRVSPDGSRIAFSGFAWKGQTYHVSKLHVMDSDGGNLKILTPDWDRDAAAPVWSADSKRISFLSDSEGATNIYAVSLSGVRRDVTSGARRLSGYSASASGLAVAIHNSPVEPGVLVAIADGKEKKIWDPNRTYLTGCPLAPAEEVRYDAADHTPIQGWVIKPPGFQPARKYPLLVSIHGGPHGSYGASFMHELQMYAAKGYVVLYANPRGSTGYGEAFGNVIQHRWPGDDIGDVLAGVDSLVRAGYADPDRLGVIGGSGGGLMTAWMVTQTTRFRAAVSLYPVTNWFTHVGSADNGYYIGSVYRKGMPWDAAPEDYLSHSPLFYAKNVRTPTMIITGDEDWRTPVAQSQEFYRALKALGVDTVFVRVPGETHGIRLHPSHRAAVIAHGMAWFDKYIPR